MKAAMPSQTLISYHTTSRSHIPEDREVYKFRSGRRRIDSLTKRGWLLGATVQTLR